MSGRIEGLFDHQILAEEEEENSGAPEKMSGVSSAARDGTTGAVGRDVAQASVSLGQTVDVSGEVTVLTSTASSGRGSGRPSLHKFCCVSILVFINLINYMDRFTISAVLPNIQKFYGINDTMSGMLSTSFILSFMFLAPVFGYLGDRYNRLVIMTFGILFWAGTTLAGSFVPSTYFWLFITLRSWVGVGEATYSTIAPTIIADLFTNEWRTAMLTVFYFAIPVGAGMGFIVAGEVEKATGNWQSVMRITPAMGLVSVVLLWLILKHDPPRGEAEGSTLQNTGWKSDLYHIMKNKSFIFSSLGYTCQCFIVGAVSFWVPTYIERAFILRGQDYDMADISRTFGLITAISGVVGVVSGTSIAGKWKLKAKTSKPDPWVSGIGLISSAPFLYFGLVYAQYNTSVTWVMVFIAEVLLCLDWAIVTDILLYTTVPTRRSLAEAVQILMSHALGDAGSSYLVGVLSDVNRRHLDNNVDSDFIALQRSLFVNPFVGIIGGLFFLICAWYIDADKEKVDLVIAGVSEDSMPSVPSILQVQHNDGMTDQMIVDNRSPSNQTELMVEAATSPVPRAVTATRRADNSSSLSPPIPWAVNS